MYCLDNTLHYLFKLNPVTLTNTEEILLSESGHLCFSAGIFLAVVKGRYSFFFFWKDLRCVEEGLLLYLLYITDVCSHVFAGADF